MTIKIQGAKYKNQQDIYESSINTLKNHNLISYQGNSNQYHNEISPLSLSPLL